MVAPETEEATVEGASDVERQCVLQSSLPPLCAWRLPPLSLLLTDETWIRAPPALNILIPTESLRPGFPASINVASTRLPSNEVPVSTSVLNPARGCPWLTPVVVGHARDGAQLELDITRVICCGAAQP